MLINHGKGPGVGLTSNFTDQQSHNHQLALHDAK